MSRIMQFCCYGYFDDLLAPITFAKNFGFPARIVYKIFKIKNAFQSKNQFLRNAFGKSYLLRHLHNNRAQKLDSRNRIYVLCKFSVFAKKYILQFFFKGKQP